MLEAPVLFLIFNRPETTALVFDRIKQQKPAKIYIAADGARRGIEGEKEKCEAAKKIVTEGIDWDCDIKTLFRNENIGCGAAVYHAISWFFEQEECGIILEDDCVPNENFFTFCNELLVKYKDDNRIMMISGCSFQREAYDNYSYYFSAYAHVWGWATWKRAWALYDLTIPNFNSSETDDFLKKVFKKKRERKLWIKNIIHAIDGSINTWDYQWMYAIWKNDSLSISPWKNLVSNIGYGEDATHTIGFDVNTIALPTYKLDVIKHPSKLNVNKKADKYIRYKLIISGITFISFIKGLIRKLIPTK